MAHWRDTYLPARIFIIDARAGMTFGLLAVHFRVYTFLFAVTVCLVFWMIERRGLSIIGAVRALRSWFVGRRRPPLRDGLMRGMVDFQRIDR